MTRAHLFVFAGGSLLIAASIAAGCSSEVESASNPSASSSATGGASSAVSTSAVSTSAISTSATGGAITSSAVTSGASGGSSSASGGSTGVGGASTSASGGSTNASGDSGGAPDCTLEVPPSGTPFLFHVHNAGTMYRGFGLGCGASPLHFDTAQWGSITPNVPGNWEDCGPSDGSCEDAYQALPMSCGDCGPGVYEDLDPDATVTFSWDRRARVGATAPAACSFGGVAASCSLAVAVDPAAMQTGSVDLCVDYLPDGDGGNCTTFSVPFNVDTTGDEATIEVE